MRLALGILLGGLLFAAACGGDDEKTGSATDTSRTTIGPSGSPAAAQQINVTLQEYSIIPEKKSAKAGKVTFNIENKGPKEPHELLMFKTDLPLDKLPTQSDGALNEDAQELDEVDETEPINPGQKTSLSVDVEPGRYILVCNVGEETGGEKVRHFQQGMVTEFTVD